MNVLIFGASSDIGKSIIDKLGPEYNVYGTKNTRGIEKDIEKEINCDIRNIEDIDDVYKNTPSLDYIIFSCMPEILETISDFEGYLEAESLLRGHVYALQRGLENLSEGGRIITMSGQSSDYGMPMAPYMAANFSYLSNLAKSYNAKSGDKKIHEFQLGPIDTKIWDRVSKKHQTVFGGEGLFIKPETVANYVKTIMDQDVSPTKIILDNFYSIKK